MAEPGRPHEERVVPALHDGHPVADRHRVIAPVVHDEEPVRRLRRLALAFVPIDALRPGDESGPRETEACLRSPSSAQPPEELAVKDLPVVLGNVSLN